MIKRETLFKLYASLQSLEKCHENSKRMLSSQLSQPAIVRSSLAQQAEVLVKMRRTANKLQFELARDDWASAGRSLRVFAGLQALVRPDIVSTFSALANDELALQLCENEALYH